MPKHNSKSTSHRKLLIPAVIAVIFIASVATFALFRSGGIFNMRTQRSETAPQSTNPEISVTKEPAEEVSDTRYLTLEDWGVKFEVPDGLGEVRYYKTADWGYEFTTQRVEDIGGKDSDFCVESNDSNRKAQRLAVLSRSIEASKSAISKPLLDRPLNGYYYYYDGAHSICSDNGTDIQIADRDSLVEMLKTISPAR